MKRIVFELIFIATTWYIFLPPLNLTSWEFLFFLCGHLLVVAILFGFGKGINLVKTVHVRHGKAEAALNLEGFKINRLGKILLASIGGILLLAALVSLVTSSMFQAKNYANVATVYQKQFGLAVPRPASVIILDATNGETKEYSLSDVPEWVDRVYPAEETIEQINYNGKYKDGFLNAMISKKNVTQTTKGYNYLSIGNDIYLYTGVTSANADESNLGFILENMRTGEITKYSLASATEESARESAEGAVQEKSYKATFPILINLNDKPLYIMGLKDNAGLVKEYALVDAVEYQNVIVATTVEEMLSKYANKNDLEIDNATTESIKGVVADLKSAVIKGDTVYFFKVDGKIYKVKASVSDDLPYLENGKTFEGQVGKDNYLKTFKVQ